MKNQQLVRQNVTLPARMAEHGREMVKNRQPHGTGHTVRRLDKNKRGPWNK